jgi:hypothetical protein
MQAVPVHTLKLATVQTQSLHRDQPAAPYVRNTIFLPPLSVLCIYVPERAMAQRLVAILLFQRAGFDPRSVFVKYVVFKLSL